MFRFLYKNKLSAYIHGELDEKTALKIKNLIETNRNFRREYEMIKAGAESWKSMTKKDVPEDIWNEITNVIDKPFEENEDRKQVLRQPFKPKFYKRPLVGAGFASAAVILIVLFSGVFTDDSGIDIDSYLDNIDSPGNLEDRFTKLPNSFELSPPDEALEIASLIDPGDVPLVGYELISQSIKYGEDKFEHITQLVYSNGSDVFTVFIGEHNSKFDFGKRVSHRVSTEGFDIDVIGSQNANSYYYNIGEKHVTLVSTIKNSDTAVRIMKFFRSAYWSTYTDYFTRPVWTDNDDSILFETFRDGHEQLYINVISRRIKFNISRSDSRDMHPAWSPLGDRIALSSDRDGNFNIYIANKEVKIIKKLTDNRDENIEPAWSPEEKSIIYTRKIGDSGDIYKVDIESLETRRITDHRADDSHPVWSPEERFVVFQSNRNGNYDLFFFDIETGELSQITNDPGDDIMPAFPRGDFTLYFSSNRNGNFDIYTINIGTREVKRITNTPEDEFYPRPSPFGETIVYTASIQGGKIFMINIDGTGKTEITRDR